MKIRVFTNAFFFLFFFLGSRAQTITTVAGTGLSGFSGDGTQALQAQFNYPVDVCFDAIGNMYVADGNNNRIRKITPGGIVSTIAGTGATGYSGDGGLATAAELTFPNNLYFDNTTGSLYFTSGCVIRKINASGIITTVAGTGTCASGTMAVSGQANNTQFKNIGAIVKGPDKKIYFTEIDASNSRIVVIDTLGMFSVFASPFFSPQDMMFDPLGNLYVCDTDNNLVKKITPQGAGTIVAGVPGNPGLGTNTGDGGPATSAKLDNPNAILMDASGNLYLSCGLKMRFINGSGIISTIAGNGSVLGDGGPPLQAIFNCADMTWGPEGNMYIAFYSFHRIRMISPGSVTGIRKINNDVLAFSLYPNPSGSNLKFIAAQLKNKHVIIEITDLLGKLVMTTQTYDLNEAEIDISAMSKGVYQVSVRSENICEIQKFIKD